MGTAALWFVLAVVGIDAAGNLAPPGAAAAQSGAGEPMMLPEPKDEATAPRREGLPGDSYVAEVVDSTFFVGPAEFFALDLPTRKAGTVATHLFGTITAVGGSRDIVVRLFEGESYDRWLKRRGGDKSGPFYTSSKSRSTQIDQPLPEGKAIIVLLDNGYSIRTPKRVHCQLQIQYRRTDGRAVPQARSGEGSAKPEGKPYDDVVPTPRSNEDDDVPPPPPPPPPDGGN
jgi:hypothetical protein